MKRLKNINKNLMKEHIERGNKYVPFIILPENDPLTIIGLQIDDYSEWDSQFPTVPQQAKNYAKRMLMKEIINIIEKKQKRNKTQYLAQQYNSNNEDRRMNQKKNFNYVRLNNTIPNDVVTDIWKTLYLSGFPNPSDSPGVPSRLDQMGYYRVPKEKLVRTNRIRSPRPSRSRSRSPRS